MTRSSRVELGERVNLQFASVRGQPYIRFFASSAMVELLLLRATMAHPDGAPFVSVRGDHADAFSQASQTAILTSDTAGEDVLA
jgi:hypothetical protein